MNSIFDDVWCENFHIWNIHTYISLFCTNFPLKFMHRFGGIALSVGVRVVCHKGKARPTFVQASEIKSTERLADLSPEYVSSLSQDISSRIKQRDSFRANSEELAARARFGK